MDLLPGGVLTVTAMNGQYLVEASQRRGSPWPAPADALTTGDDHWIAVLTGTWHGPVTITTAVARRPPAQPEHGWDMIGERDLVVTGAPVLIRDLHSDIPPHRLDLDSGRYRVRIHVRGRARAARADTARAAAEHHQILFFPAGQARPPATLTGPDDFARTFR